MTHDNSSSVDRDGDSMDDALEEHTDGDEDDSAIWGNIKRKEGRQSDVRDDDLDLFKATKAVLLTKIMTGEGANDLTPWPEHNTKAIGELIGTTWQDQKRNLRKTDRRIQDASNYPLEIEARKVTEPSHPADPEYA